MVRHLIPAALLLSVLAGPAAAPADTGTVDAGMATAAKAWLRSLGKDADAATFPFTDDERFDWRFVPGSRRGARIGDMTADQRRATEGLMRSTLSAAGVRKAEAIMALEAVLAEIEGSSLSYRDPGKFYVTVFGAPGAHPWGWRLEGHHLSINVTVAEPGAVSVTPAFLGSNPARVPAGPDRGKRVQRDEHVLALRLAQSLDKAQAEGALLAERALGRVVAGPGRGDALKTPDGLPVTRLSAGQQSLLTDLIGAYVGIARDEIGRPYMDLVREGWAATRFAWAGSMAEGEGFYYRIHGPRILIEFDNTQGGGNHIHSLWRDPANDFGRDDLHRHYRDAAGSHGHRP